MILSEGISMRKPNLDKILAVTCLLLILYIVYSFVFHSLSKKPTQKARNAFIDLQDIDFSKGGAVYLAGDWAFYPFAFIDPLSQEDLPRGYIDVPTLWNSFVYNGKPMGADGYGSYRLKIRVAENTGQLGLKLPNMSSAYRLYINGDLIAQNGRPGTSKEIEIPQWKPGVAFYNPTTTELDLVVHISNFHHAKGGMWENILIGNKDDVVKFREVNLMRSHLLVGILSIIAIFLLLFSLIEKNIPSLSLGLFCFFSVLREIVVREIPIWNFVADISFAALARLEYITMPLGALFYTMFFYYMYKNKYNRIVYLGITLFSCLLILFTLVAEPRTFSQFVRYYILDVLVAFTAAVVVVFRSFIKGRSSSGVVLLGCLLLLLAAINDTLHVENRSLDFSTSHIYALAFLIFIFCQIHLIYINISDNYKKAKQTVETQLKLLQSQIEPHFLCNVLNNIQELIDNNPQESKKLLDELSHFLRSKFKYNSVIHDDLISVQEELGIVSSYIAMQNARFRSCLDLKYEIDTQCLNRMIRPFLIQPLVENAVRHGFSGERLEILVSAKEAKNGEMVISVRDNGVGMSKTELYHIFEEQKEQTEEKARNGDLSSGNGLGLRNIRKRMQLYYNNDIKIHSEKGRGTEVTLVFPMS